MNPFFFWLKIRIQYFYTFLTIKKKPTCSPNLANPQEFATLDLETFYKRIQTL